MTPDWEVWADAVLRMAGGDYRSAFDGFTVAADCADAELAGLALAGRASGLRQLSEHDVAADLDRKAIEAGGHAGVDGRIGLAADALGGTGGAERALRELALLPETLTRRDRIRCGWVRAEALLVADDAEAALTVATSALHMSAAAGYPRHLIKSRLIAAVAGRMAGREDARHELGRVVRDADAAGLRPLVWSAVAALDDDADPAELAAGAAAVRFQAAHLPAGIGSRWLAQPAVRRLATLQ